jgi:hypothetical protein
MTVENQKNQEIAIVMKKPMEWFKIARIGHVI